MNSLFKDVFSLNKPILNYTIVRYFRTKGFTKGQTPGQARTIQDILRQLRHKDESLYYKVDIGLPYSQGIKAKEQDAREKYLKDLKKNKELEKLARKNELRISLDEVFDEWVKSDGPGHLKKIADHYGIFEHLFGDAYFYPVTPLNIAYELDNEEYAPVYYGNQIKPNEAKKAPIVEIEPKKDTYHTLVLCNLDGHLMANGKEYVHWFVGNIPDGDITKGDTIYEYFQPFPTYGTGYHRLVFVLYEHTEKLDYSSLPNKKIPSHIPESRTFLTYDFYKDRQDFITPTGLRFFQADWDTSVTEVFHTTFKMAEPRFEFVFPKTKVNPQKWFPKKEPFNVYLDKYRDPKDISKQVLLKKLKTHHPFTVPEPPLKFPHAHSLHDTQNLPTWQQIEIKKERLGWGKQINDNLDILYPEKM